MRNKINHPKTYADSQQGAIDLLINEGGYTKEFLKGFNFFPDKQCVGGVWGASSKKENMSFIIYTHDSDFEGGEYLDLIQN